ncbi:M20 family metallopeptidase [Mesobacillus maritimus]|uniref:M20 family metallopeptidase n=1 Tax=Mesobacillus maritimus TaxID=1643336 RepID=UPI0020411BDE|nr:M20 family metallopeptidase [Mesobacillus maritimus]MCM3585772.1 M20 family metallopeptidase [Mesobacillus maritimus]MCM3670531.1 M20 family metallopeptidase [Mesobacillus maritimus]
MLLNELLQKLEEKKDRIIEIRRYLHEHPELSFEEEQTANYIADFYKEVNVDSVETNFGGERGIVVTIKGSKPGKTIAIRADFDALPIKEETGLPFASKNEGVMHACGHDGHTAYMLILAETLAEHKDQLAGTIRVIHQPAEETPPGGAIGMIKAGVLDGVDAILGIHVMSNMKTGNIYYRSGNTQTGRSYFKLVVQGKGGHGSSPHLANDAIVAASSFVMNVQTIVSRRINPFDAASVTIGNFDGKGSFNVIKDSVTIEGDVRTMSPETRETVEREVQAFAEGLERSYGVKATLEYKNDYPVLYNDPDVTEQVRQALEQASIPEVEEVLETPPQPPSEDFAYYLEKVPGCFFYVGAIPESGEAYPHHHPKFDINEKSLIISAKAMAAVVASYCDGSEK